MPRGTGFGLTDSPQEVEAGTLEALRSSIATLGAKAPDEANAYRELVRGTATRVAEAKGGVHGGRDSHDRQARGRAQRRRLDPRVWFSCGGTDA